MNTCWDTHILDQHVTSLRSNGQEQLLQVVTLLRVSLLTAPGFPQKPGPTQQYNLLNHSFTFQRKIFKDVGRGGARGHLGFGRWLIFFLGEG